VIQPHRRHPGARVVPWFAAALLAGAASASFADMSPADRREIAIAEDRRAPLADGLGAFLTHADPATRARAALAVGRIQDSTTVEALAPLVADPDQGVRREAVFALGQIGHRSARPRLEAALADADRDVVKLALEALGKLADPAATPRVVEFLRHADPGLRAESAVALWRIADSTAVARLIERHDDPDPEVRWRVMYALEKIKAPDQIVLIAALHQDDDSDRVRAHAARTLGRQLSPRGTSYLLQMIEDRSPAVVVNALRALRTNADSTCSLCGPVIARRFGHTWPEVRQTTAQVLSEPRLLAAADSAGRATVLDSLRARLVDTDGATRAAAASALLALEGEAAWDEVEPLLIDPSFYVRAALITELGRLSGERFEAPLLERLSWRTPLLERMSAALALGARGGRRVAPLLRTELYDRNLLYVAAVAGALEQLGDSASVPSLARVYAARVGDADSDARIAIRDALRTLAGRALADSLEAAHAAVPEGTDYAEDYGTPPRAARAVLKTSRGEIVWSFLAAAAPKTVANFVKLARTGYFDGSLVHRVVPDFVMQDGDPTATGWGGPGYAIRCEYNQHRYDPGMVGMALSGKDTGGSQWFITLAPQPHLNGRYTIFAKVESGLDVASRIVQGDRILSVEIFE
jgi:cyclophilin family peptidyl-prolyl cis-trans isomerase/HEAT repeat protein